MRTRADRTGLSSVSLPSDTSYMFSHVSLMGSVRLTADKREQDGISKERNCQRTQRSVLVSPEFLSRLSINSCVGLMFKIALNLLTRSLALSSIPSYLPQTLAPSLPPSSSLPPSLPPSSHLSMYVAVYHLISMGPSTCV